MSNLREKIDNIIISIIQILSGKTVAHDNYTDAILDTILEALPSEKPSLYEAKTLDAEGYIRYKAGYNEALSEVKNIILEAKGGK